MSTQIIGLAFGGLGTLFALLCVLFLRQRGQLRAARQGVKRAKQETAEIVQLATANPYPLVEISDDREILFFNPAALDTFPSLMEEGERHKVLSDLPSANSLKNAQSSEIEFENRTYLRSIRPRTRANSLLLYFYDISDRQQYERELKEARKEAISERNEAQKANRARGDFLANMSHELRTPMNGIIGVSDILLEEGLPKEQKEMVGAVNVSARSLLNLINDILDFSKIEAGEITLETVAFQPADLARQLETIHKPSMAHKGLSFSLQFDASIPRALRGDPTRLQQVINNLLGNAIKFTEEGSIGLRFSGQPNRAGTFELNIEIADTGIGIPENKQASIFGRFQQAETSTTRRFGGTGLGLAITKDLVELMGGRISLESTVNEGSTFRVKLPLEICSEDECPNQVDSGYVGAEFNLDARVLVVDDHPINIFYLNQMLTRAGFEHIDKAENGRVALELFNQHTYDLILLDCQMPEIDGFEVARTIRKSHADKPPIIAVTADALRETKERCHAAGMDDYITKPCDKQTLLSLLSKWLPNSDQAASMANEKAEEEKSTKQEPVAPGPTAPKLCLINRQQLGEFTDGDPQFERELLLMFLDNLEQDTKALTESFESEAFDVWESLAHRIYGSASNIGAERLAVVCDEVHRPDGFDPVLIGRIHRAILSEVHTLSSHLAPVRQPALGQHNVSAELV